MSLLSTSSSALLAFRRALDTVSHNVANANTDGYSRQRAELASNGGQVNGFGFVGAGVHVDAITRTVDRFHFGRMLDGAGEYGRLELLAGFSARIDRSFSDEGTGLAAPWSGFFDAGAAVAGSPASATSRQSLLHAGETMAARFRSLDTGLAGLDREINGRLADTVGNANRLLGDVANLNREISRQRALAGGQQPNDLLDERERLAGELGKLLGVTSLMQDDGAMNLFLAGGQALLVGTRAQTLTTVQDEFRASRLDVGLQSGGNVVRIGAGLAGGQLRGLLEYREDVLDPAATQLGRVAATLADRFNSAHRDGIDLYGAPGGDFFTPLQPVIRQSTQNSGSGTCTATLADPASFDGRDVMLAYDGTNWLATSADSGLPVTMSGAGTVANPLRVGGVDLVMGGSPVAGDRILLQPATGAAARLRVAITDPSRIAAASPHVATAALTNTGDAHVLRVDVDDSSVPGFLTPAVVAFTTATTCTIDGNGPYAYDETTGIVGAGWTLRLSGPPAAGDTFAVNPRGPGSSDNGNARLFAVLDEVAMLDGGTLTLGAALADITVRAGFSAQQHTHARDAQGIINGQVAAEREAISGVNLDEEAANLMKFQQSYQAAAQMVSTADTLFQTLLAAVRR